MTEFLTYDLKVAVLIAVFYFCYRLLMERETFHRLNRIVLLSSIALSLVLPLCVITFHETVEVEQTTATANPNPQSPITDMPAVTAADSEQMAPIDQSAVIFAIFVFGLLCRLFYIANSYRLLRRIISDSEQHTLEDDVTLAVVDLPVAPFSWMRTIVLSRIDYDERNPSILAHERGHIRLHHSWDIVFVEMLTALQWFNPVVWLLRRDLRTVHEYEADASVLSSDSDVSQYIQLLMRKATGTKASILANGINNSTIKKRIFMLLKHKSNRRAWLKALYIAPIVAVSLVATAKTVTEFKPKPTNHVTPTAVSTDTLSISNTLVWILTQEQLKKAKTITPGAPGSISISAAIHDNGIAIDKNNSFFYQIRVPKGCWVEDDEDSWIEVSWDRFLFAGKTTKIQLDGVAFDENSAPKLHYSVLKKIENHRKGNVNVVNLITKPVSIPSGIKNNASKK